MTRVGSAGPSREEVRGELAAEPRLSWLLRRKVTVPERTPGYLDRERLVQRALPTRNRLSVLLAPGGFGKTTLLAECCRPLSESGVPTAWLSVDASDDAEVFDSYLAFAFQYAGLAIEGAPARGGVSASRVGQLAHALEACGEPVVLAIDDLHQLSDPGAVAHLDFLIRRGPANLHLAATCRRLPIGLDIGGLLLDGQALVVGAEELRFTPSEINDFFGLRLTRRDPPVDEVGHGPGAAVVDPGLERAGEKLCLERPVMPALERIEGMRGAQVRRRAPAPARGVAVPASAAVGAEKVRGIARDLLGAGDRELACPGPVAEVIDEVAQRLPGVAQAQVLLERMRPLVRERKSGQSGAAAHHDDARRGEIDDRAAQGAVAHADTETEPAVE